MRNLVWGFLFVIAAATTSAWSADVSDEKAADATQSVSAKDLFEQAAQQAKTENKNLLVLFGRVSCGACQHLKALLAKPELKQLLSQDYVILTIDIETMAGGKDVYYYFRNGQGGKIPWTAIIDANGKKLAEFEGYPRGDEGAQGFVKLLDEHGRNLTPDQLASIETILKGGPAQAAPVKAEKQPMAEKQPKQAKQPKGDTRKYRIISAPAPSGRAQ